jgi:hypothetical protein
VFVVQSPIEHLTTEGVATTPRRYAWKQTPSGEDLNCTA